MSHTSLQVLFKQNISKYLQPSRLNVWILGLVHSGISRLGAFGIPKAD